jgi:hypothetical protein
MQVVWSGTDVLKLRLVSGKFTVVPTPVAVVLKVIAIEQLRRHDFAVHAAVDAQDAMPPLLFAYPGLVP